MIACQFTGQVNSPQHSTQDNANIEAGSLAQYKEFPKTANEKQSDEQQKPLDRYCLPNINGIDRLSSSAPAKSVAE